MFAFDLLKDKEKELIDRYIRTYGPIDTDSFEACNMQSLETILNEWNINKSKDLLTLFGGKDLILTRPYSYVAQTEALSQKIDEALNDPASRAFTAWYDTMTHTAGNTIIPCNMQGEPLNLRPNYFYNPWHPINECKTSMALAANAYLGENCIIKFPNSGKQMKLFKGMKPMKVLHRIVQEYHGSEDIFDAYRTWHSMQLNQRTMDGELCLSIHPLDYMTMSDNDNNWNSCMRWSDKGTSETHGDFRSGTVQCLNSPYIIVAYLHNPSHGFYPCGEDLKWNSKQWRELFIVNDGVINEIKGYPFQDENLTNACLMWIKELAAKNLGWTYDNEEVDVGRNITEENDTTQIFLTYDAGTFMYKDIGSIQKHRGRVNKEKLMSGKYLIQESEGSLLNKPLKTYFITIPYGGTGTCMSCGRSLPYERSERVMCDYCDRVTVCDCCGQIIEDDNIFWVDDRDGPLCESCFCDECAYDSFNQDEAHTYCNMTEIWLLLGYDSNDKPVFHENVAMTYDPDSNYSNLRSVFPNGYAEMDYEDGYFKTTRNYVTIDGIEEGYTRDACDAFDIYPRDLDRFYDRCIADYDLVYDYNHKPLFEEEEDED